MMTKRLMIVKRNHGKSYLYNRLYYKCLSMYNVSVKCLITVVNVRIIVLVFCLLSFQTVIIITVMAVKMSTVTYAEAIGDNQSSRVSYNYIATNGSSFHFQLKSHLQCAEDT